MTVNPKYVELLNRTYDKYRSVDIIHSKHSQGDNKLDFIKTSLSSNDIIPTCERNPRKAKHVAMPRNKNLDLKVIVPNNLKMKTKKTNKDTVKVYGFKRQKYLESEDKILMEAINTGNTSDLKALSQKLNRDCGSLMNRIKKLSRSNLENKIVHKSFSLEEDKLIIDSVLERYTSNKDKPFLEAVQNPADLSEVSLNLKRVKFSVYDRWMRFIRVTLESFAHKTLDLDVRLMLANFLSDNFSSITSIDWHTVVSRPEFRGHSEFSLRKIFWSTLVRTAATDLGVSRTQLSLQQVAQHAQSGLKKIRNVKKVKKRQLDLIDYFQYACNGKGICDYMTLLLVE